MYEDAIDGAINGIFGVVKWTLVLLMFVFVLYWRIIRPDPMKRISLSIGVLLAGGLIYLAAV
jgi:hypothetical protein